MRKEAAFVGDIFFETVDAPVLRQRSPINQSG